MIDEKQIALKRKAQHQENRIDDARSATITAKNFYLQQASSDISAVENCILALLLSKLDPTKTELEPVSTTTSELMACMGYKSRGGSAYTAMKENLMSLRSRTWWIEKTIEESERDAKGRPITKVVKCESAVGYIDKIDIYDRTHVSVTFSSSIKPYFTDVIRGGNYSAAVVEPLLAMRKTHAFQKLYMYLVSKAYLREVTLPVAEIRRITTCTDRYLQYRDLKNKIILPCIEEINRYAFIGVEYDEIREGRAVESITFFIYQKSPAERYQAHMRAKEVLDGVAD